MICWNGKNLCEKCMKECTENECVHCDKEELTSTLPTGCLPARTILQERYIIGRVLGRGGFGITYLAFDMEEECRVAIKEYFPDTLVYRQPGEVRVSTYTDLEQAESFRTGSEKFYAEAQTMAQFNGHPNIVKVKRFFYANETAYYVMEYLEGIDLKRYIAGQEKRISFDEVLQLLLPIMDVMAMVHEKNILHRDISPDNIFIVNDGTVKLLDFGSARQVLSEQSQSLSVILKVGYTPVEQYQSHGKQGPWTDVYALAATMYYCLTGITPIASLDRVEKDSLKSISEVCPELGKMADEVFAKALAVRPAKRYQCIREFRDGLLKLEKSKMKAAFMNRKVALLLIFVVLLCLPGVYFVTAGLSTDKQVDGNSLLSETAEPTDTPTPEPTSTPIPSPELTRAADYPEPYLHFYKGYVEETEVIWEGKGWGPSPTSWMANCYNYADDSTVDIPLDMVELGDGYVWFKDGFLETLEPSVYKVTLTVDGLPSGIPDTTSVVLEVHDETVVPVNSDGRSILRAKYIPASTKHYGVSTLISNQSTVRFTGAWVSVDNGRSFDKLDESNYKIVADGKVMMIDKRYFGKYEGVEEFTILYFFDDKTTEYLQLYFYY